MYHRIPRGRRASLRYLAAAGTALTAAGALHAQETERFELRGDRLAIHNLVGSINVEGAAGAGPATVEVTRRGRDGGQLRIETGMVEGRETLRVIYPSRRITFDGGFSRGWFELDHVYVRRDGRLGGARREVERYEISSRPGGFEGYAEITVRIPAGRAITVNLAAGAARVTNVDGDVVVDVQAATVTTSRTRGRLALDTGSGAVDVSDAAGSVLIDSGSGTVQLRRITAEDMTVDSGSGRVTGEDISVRDLNVDSGSGPIRLASVNAREIRIDSGSGSVDLDLASDIDRLVAETGSGRLTLRLPESLGARLSAETGRRGLDIDFPITITRRGDDYVRGTIGDGRGDIRIDTGSGGVRLTRRGG